MGIPFYYGQLRDDPRFRNVIQQRLPSNVSSLSIDANALIYEIKALVYDESTPEKKRLLAQADPLHLEVELFQAIGNHLIAMIEMIRPVDTFVFAIDGPVNAAKIV